MTSKILNIADQVRLRSNGYPEISSAIFYACVWTLILVGIAARLTPLIDWNERLFWQYMTEDGYLLQTVARNISIGFGMATSEGTIPTNGVQPLSVFLFAALHYISGGSKEIGIALVTLFSAFVATGAGYYAYKVALRIFANLRHGQALAMISAALWFAAPHTIIHSMNGLETGLYFFSILFTLDYYLAAISEDNRSFAIRKRLTLGLLMGITFLARNDAVFFIGGLLFAHLILGGETVGGGRRHRLIDCLAVGIISLVVASPWLINNYTLFGSIVPISGLSESRGAHFGQNLPGIPAHLFESSFLYAPLPGSMEHMPSIILMSITGVAISLAGFWLTVARLTLPARRFFLGSLLFLLGIISYYGLFFAAPHFLARYISPLSPFLWFSSTVTAFYVLNYFIHSSGGVRRAISLIVSVLTIVAALFAYVDFARGFAKGTSHDHKQVVKWVQEKVPESQWVGAPQTGTLGFFHDRTINLDGKVNPNALRAILEQGDVLEYARNSEINYIADWLGVTNWMKIKGATKFEQEFEVVVRDEQSNLGVLRRIHPILQ